jgi:hypothetical protein
MNPELSSKLTLSDNTNCHRFCKTLSQQKRIVLQSAVRLHLKRFNPLNAELNPICNLLILLGDLTFMGTCIISIFNKMKRYTVYLYLETALHVSCGNSTHHQEHIQLYLQHLVFVIPLLLSAAIVEVLEPVWVFCGWRTPPTEHSNRFCVWRTPTAAHSNRFQLFHDRGR